MDATASRLGAVILDVYNMKWEETIGDSKRECSVWASKLEREKSELEVIPLDDGMNSQLRLLWGNVALRWPRRLQSKDRGYLPSCSVHRRRVVVSNKGVERTRVPPKGRRRGLANCALRIESQPNLRGSRELA
jgi:hypothetical protein